MKTAVILVLVVMLCYQVEGGKKRTPGVGECVSNCRKIRNGDYQSCDGCDVYVTCSNGLITEDRPCAASLVWNDETRQCAGTSPTCDEAYPSVHRLCGTVSSCCLLDGCQ